MSNYSYSEIQNMQKKALERVREMRKNSEKLLEESDTTPYIKPKQFFEEPNQQIKPKITNMPPNFPENTAYPDFKEFFKKEEQKEQQKEQAKRINIPVEKTKLNILDEPDKAIILGLIMLLKSEGADEILIMALMYILS